MNSPQIPLQRQACTGRLYCLSVRFASSSSPNREGVRSCASPPPGRPETAHRWQRTVAGYRAAPGVCLRWKWRAGAVPGGGSAGTCPLSSPGPRSWGSLGCCSRRTGAPRTLHASSPTLCARYILGRSLSSTSREWRWKTSRLKQFWAPLKPFIPTTTVCQTGWKLILCLYKQVTCRNAIEML